MSAALARTRGLRLVGLAIALLFIASMGAVWSTPAEARNWTPQIQSTRRAQIYWESAMRRADAELRSLRKAKVQTQRKLRSVRSKAQAAVARRSTTRDRAKDAKTDLVRARAALKAAQTPTPPPPLAADALETLIEDALVIPPLAALPRTVASTEIPAAEVPAADPGDEPATAAASEGRKALKRLERETRKTKRDFRQAKRKASRSLRNVRDLRSRLRSIRSATRQATIRREVAERNLGAWILAMTRYGRIRASKKSDVRPGIDSSFAWPVRGSISQYYHAGHDGLDIVRYRGAPIRSMAFGVVTYVGWNPWDQHGRAFMVVVTHAGGYETLYGHLLPRRIVRVGEEVRKGQVIGYMGSTGNSTGPHLHLELRRGRTTLNPLGVL